MDVIDVIVAGVRIETRSIIKLIGSVYCLTACSSSSSVMPKFLVLIQLMPHFVISRSQNLIAELKSR